MDTRVSKKYVLIPLLYIGLIGILLYLQFAREEPFNLGFGKLVVSGHVMAGQSNPPALADVKLRMNGLTFSFSRSTPVRVVLENGSSQSVSIKSYASVANGIDLSFSSGLGLRFIVGGKDRDTLSIVPSMPNGVHVASVSFPYNVAKNDKTDTRAGIPALAVTQQGPSGPKTHVLSLPFNSEIRPSEQLLVLTTTGGKFSPAVYSPAAKPNLDPIVYWFGQNGELPSAASFDKSVKDYLDKAWNGWTDTRFDASAATWQMRDGSPTFKESIVIALLSEALERGSYGTWLQTMQKAASLRPQDITLRTTPYFGNLLQTYTAFEPVLTQELARDKAQIEQPGDTALDTEGLLRFVADHGGEPTVQAVLAKMKSTDIAKESLSTVLKLLDDDLTAAQLGYSADQFTAFARKIVDQRVLPAIIRTESGFYLQSETGVADIASSIFAGRLLIRAGNRTRDSILDGIGYRLVASSLSLSDNEGFLPGRLAITGDSVSGTEGFLAPEQVYRWVAPSSYYAREIPLRAQIGPDVWAWAASQITSVDSTQNQLAITFDFPAGQIEHIVLHGIKPFTSMKLYGIAWRSDPTFERYAAGWVYDPTSETLFIKLQHKQQNETVDIIY